MDKKKRIEYLLITSSVFISSFIIYGLLGSTMEGNKLTSFVLFGLLSGFGFSTLLSAIILTARYFSKKSLKFKVIASILWPITVACSFYVCSLIYIPYQIYNIVKIIKTSKKNI